MLLLMGAGSIITLRFAFTAHAAAVSVNFESRWARDGIGQRALDIYR
jgi:hypothetical protein